MFHSSKKGVFKLWDFGTIYGLPWVNKLMQTFILAVTQFFESFMLEPRIYKGRIDGDSYYTM